MVIYPVSVNSSSSIPGSFTMWILLLLAVNIVCLVGKWKMYQKAGKPFWAIFVPFYSDYVLFQIVYGDGKGWSFLKLLIPLFNIYVVIKLYLDLAKVFGQPVAFGIGLIFLSSIFICILGFGDAVYQGGGSGRFDRVSDEDRTAALNKLRQRNMNRE